MIEKEAWFRKAYPRALTPSQKERELTRTDEEGETEVARRTGVSIEFVRFIQELASNLKRMGDSLREVSDRVSPYAHYRRSLLVVHNDLMDLYRVVVNMEGDSTRRRKVLDASKLSRTLEESLQSLQQVTEEMIEIAREGGFLFYEEVIVPAADKLRRSVAVCLEEIGASHS